MKLHSCIDKTTSWLDGGCRQQLPGASRWTKAAAQAELDVRESGLTIACECECGEDDADTIFVFLYSHPSLSFACAISCFIFALLNQVFIMALMGSENGLVNVILLHTNLVVLGFQVQLRKDSCSS